MIKCERCQEEVGVAQARFDIKLVLKFKGRGGTTTRDLFDTLCYRYYRELGKSINQTIEGFSSERAEINHPRLCQKLLKGNDPSTPSQT